jgi:glutamate-1-semialdehyde 2,1-aminomutase
MTIKKSLAMQDRARNRIPGMTQLLSKRPDMFAPGAWPAYYHKAEGVEVWDLDENKYIDMSIGGIGANILGYSDPDVDRAVIDAIKKGSSSSLNCAEEVELADLLCELHPWADMVRYARSGGEAMAIAVRIARAHTGKDKIAFCGYHGWHDWYLAANLNTGTELNDHHITGLEPKGVPKGLTHTAFPFRYNHPEELRSIVEVHRKNLAAIVMEPIRSEEPAPGFLEEIRDIADETSAVLIIDEISAGFRLNPGGAHLKFEMVPDIAVFSKSIGNGYPMAAIIGKQDVMQSAQNTFISSTMWTERIGPVAAIATIRKFMEKDVHKHLKAIGSAVQAGWKEQAKKHGIQITIGGIAPLGHFTFDHPEALSIKAYFVQLMLERGFLASNLFYAMYAHNLIHVEQYLSSVGESFEIVAKAISDESLDERINHRPASSGFKRLA